MPVEGLLEDFGQRGDFLTDDPGRSRSRSLVGVVAQGLAQGGLELGDVVCGDAGGFEVSRQIQHSTGEERRVS